MINDSALAAAIDVVGIHYPAINGSNPLPPQFSSKPLWGSEDGFSLSLNGSSDWAKAQFLAKAYNRPYIDGKVTSHLIWAPISSFYDIFFLAGAGLMYANTPWSGNFNVQPAIWATAHTTQFAQPGWQYIDGACGYLSNGGSFVTLKNGTDYSVIVETTDSGSSQTLNFNVSGGLSTGTLHVWKTDVNTQFIQQADIVPVSGSFSITVAGGSIYSLTTTTGQGKGNAQPPPAAAFPFPYSDDFESYAIDSQAKYFSDLNGSFEITPCGGGRNGLCVRQAVPAAPIYWSLVGPFQPATVLGDINWTNYQVSADVLLEQAGSAKIFGRMAGENLNSGDITAYQLYLDNLGNWSLKHGNFNYLASGSVAPIGLNTWHNLKLVINGSTLQVVIDGVTVNTTNNINISHGMAGIGTLGWTTAQFDNFRVDPIGGSTPTPTPTPTLHLQRLRLLRLRPHPRPHLREATLLLPGHSARTGTITPGGLG